MSGVVTVPELLEGHTVLDIECLDRIYLNGYVPKLQVGGQVITFLHDHRGMRRPIRPEQPVEMGSAGHPARPRRCADGQHAGPEPGGHGQQPGGLGLGVHTGRNLPGLPAADMTLQ